MLAAMALRPDLRLTYEDYAELPDDGRRHELVDGELFEMSAPSVRHQDIVGKIYRRLADHLDRHDDGRVFLSPCDVLLSDFDVVQPDVIFVARADAGIVTEPNLKGTPTLLIEVLSDARHDRVRKRDLYARFGVGEYWIVDPHADRVEVYRLAGTTYEKPVIMEPGEKLSTAVIPELSLDVADILCQ